MQSGIVLSSYFARLLVAGACILMFENSISGKLNCFFEDIHQFQKISTITGRRFPDVAKIEILEPLEFETNWLSMRPRTFATTRSALVAPRDASGDRC